MFWWIRFNTISIQTLPKQWNLLIWHCLYYNGKIDIFHLTCLYGNLFILNDAHVNLMDIFIMKCMMYFQSTFLIKRLNHSLLSASVGVTPLHTPPPALNQLYIILSQKWFTHVAVLDGQAHSRKFTSSGLSTQPFNYSCGMATRDTLSLSIMTFLPAVPGIGHSRGPLQQPTEYYWGWCQRDWPRWEYYLSLYPQIDIFSKFESYYSTQTKSSNLTDVSAAKVQRCLSHLITIDDA